MITKSSFKVPIITFWPFIDSIEACFISILSIWNSASNRIQGVYLFVQCFNFLVQDVSGAVKSWGTKLAKTFNHGSAIWKGKYCLVFVDFCIALQLSQKHNNEWTLRKQSCAINQMSVKLVRSAISLNEIAWHGFSPLFYLSPQKPITHLVTYQLFKAEYFSFSSSSPYWR